MYDQTYSSASEFVGWQVSKGGPFDIFACREFSDVAPGTKARYVPALPVLSGAPEVGAALGFTDVAWLGTAPIATTPQWSRCDATGAACAAIPGATGATYTPVAEDVGSTLRVTVTATNVVGTGVTRPSAPSAVVETSVVATPTPTVTATPCPDCEPAVTLSNLKVKPKTFRVKGVKPGTRKGKRAKKGTRISFTLSGPGTVVFTVLRKGKVKASFVDAGVEGVNRVPFSGRVVNRPLRPGRYKLRATVGDNPPVTKRFKIVR